METTEKELPCPYKGSWIGDSAWFLDSAQTVDIHIGLEFFVLFCFFLFLFLVEGLQGCAEYTWKD